MGTFRKKPVVISAEQFMPGAKFTEMWVLEALATGKIYYQGGEVPYLTIETLEGTMRADVGDWIIRGVKGELYPCKPDIFEATYDQL